MALRVLACVLALLVAPAPVHAHGLRGADERQVAAERVPGASQEATTIALLVVPLALLGAGAVAVARATRPSPARGPEAA